MDDHAFTHTAYGLRKDGTIGPETADNPVMTMLDAMAYFLSNPVYEFLDGTIGVVEGPRQQDGTF